MPGGYRKLPVPLQAGKDGTDCPADDVRHQCKHHHPCHVCLVTQQYQEEASHTNQWKEDLEENLENEEFAGPYVGHLHGGGELPIQPPLM